MHNGNEMPTYLTVQEVAEVLRVSVTWVYQLVREGEIPHIRVGGAIRIDLGLFREWLKGKERGRPAPEGGKEGEPAGLGERG